MSLELRQLRHVLALADLGSFARAAAALGISQPALSRSIQGLEEALGSPLFRRRRSGTRPTEAGELFVERAREVVTLANALDRQEQADRVFQYGRITFGSGPFPVYTVLAPALARFIAACPHVTAVVKVRDWDELLQGLERREIDFFVAETSTLEKEPHVAVEPIGVRPLYFVARRGHPLTGRRDVTTVDALSYPVLSLSRIPPRILEPVRTAQRVAQDRGVVPRAFPAAECSSLEALARVVRDTDAVMAVTLASVAAELDRGELVLLGTEPWLNLRYGIVRSRTAPLGADAAQLATFIREAERDAAFEEASLVERWASVRPAPRKRRR